MLSRFYPKKKFILEPKIYQIPFYILTEYLSHRDLIRLSKIDPFLKREVYHKTKPFTYAVTNLKYTEIFSSTFKNVQLELTYENDAANSTPREVIKLKHISSSIILEKVNHIKCTLLPHYPKIKAETESMLALINTKIPTLKSLAITYNHYFNDEYFDNLLNLENFDFRLCSPCAKHDPTMAALISDRGLTKLTNLKSLTLMFPNVTDQCFSCLIHLTKLDVRGNNNLSDKSIEKLTDLLNLSLTDIPNVTDQSISLLTNLQRLKIADVPTISNEGIRHLTNLKCLSIRNNKNISHEGLQYLTNLERFSIDSPNLFPLYFNKLNHLTITHNVPIDDRIFESTNSTALTSLTIHRNETLINQSISGLTNLRKLKLLNVSKITAAAFKNLRQLECLHYDTTWKLYEKDLLHLTNLTSLTLICDEYIIDKGSSLKSLSGLTYLNLVCGQKYYSNAYKLFPNLIQFKTADYRADDKRVPFKLVLIVVVIMLICLALR
ncbi:MAG: hypothetical protein Hyperionvirus2_192 [Hyperionvirus sp.]|uniref:Leucine-rich repeat protein n=1 Tax=Hyperionvirus sp. TaxID=2487770 RepID=A0A3G5A8J8_9VIRU|nr:MAG: hypothetical protein Hyperionvirus2_192 [Hyperionvirus sp.]